MRVCRVVVCEQGCPGVCRCEVSGRKAQGSGGREATQAWVKRRPPGIGEKVKGRQCEGVRVGHRQVCVGSPAEREGGNVCVQAGEGRASSLPTCMHYPGISSLPSPFPLPPDNLMANNEYHTYTNSLSSSFQEGFLQARKERENHKVVILFSH